MTSVKGQFALVYLNEVYIFYKSQKEYICHIQEVLIVLDNTGAIIKLKNSMSFAKFVMYFGTYDPFMTHQNGIPRSRRNERT